MFNKNKKGSKQPVKGKQTAAVKEKKKAKEPAKATKPVKSAKPVKEKKPVKKTKEVVEPIVEPVIEPEEETDLELDVSVEEAVSEQEPEYEHKMPQKRKTIITVLLFIVLLLICLAVVDFFYIKNRAEKEKQYLSVVSELSEENIVQEASEEMIPMYNFLLYGKHQSAVQNATNGIAYFEFDANGSFKGYSAASEEDTGTYEITVENEEYLLTISCDSGMTSTYTIDFTNSKDVRLTGVDKTKGTYILFK